MGHTTDSWFSINLDEPFVFVPEPTLPSSSSASSSSSRSRTGSQRNDDSINGTIIIRITKQTKIKSLNLTFTGFARSTFYFDSSKIPSANECTHYDKHSYGCTLVEKTQTFLPKTKIPHVLPIGTHRFPFSFAIDHSLPTVVSSRAISISYRLTATLHPQSFLPFSTSHHIIQPVILLQRDEFPRDDMFNTSHFHITSERSDRFSCQASLPCSVLPQAGTVPLMLNLALKRNATTITKVTIELLESVFMLDASDPNRVTDVLVDERLVTRQNCPLQDWPASMADEPVVVSKRLMFRVPVLPLTTWSKPEETLSHFRSGLDRGLCHSSGTHPLVNVRIAHSIRIIIEARGLSEDAESKVEHDSGEAVTNVWIVSNQEYQDDDAHLPSYYRSFSTALVEGDKIQEMDQLTIEALQDDILPPCYEDSVGSSSTLSSPTLTNISETSFDQVSWHEDLPGNTDAPSYSYPILAM